MFDAANGEICKCTAIGDMPVLAKDSTGKIFRFVFTNVRYVPEFKYTLISVKQMQARARHQAIVRRLEQVDVPQWQLECHSTRGSDCTPSPLSASRCSSNGLAAIEKSNRGQAKVKNVSCVGFHNVKSTSHVARLPAAQASELIHRRCHHGRQQDTGSAACVGDAPKILGSAIPCTCVHCAAAQIRRAGHSRHMDTPDPEPGILHIDLKGPFPLSVAGKFRYAAFVIDEHSRFVFVEFLHDKSEVIDATKRVMAKFNALVGTPVDETGVALLPSEGSPPSP